MTEPVTDARARGARRARARHAPTAATAAASASRSRTCRRSRPTSTRRSTSRGSASCAVDVAYGGAFCAFVDAEALGYAIVPEEARELAELGERIRPAVAEQLEIAHPAEPALGVLSFVVFTAAPRDGGDARNATVVAPGRLDRCATGTATSARLAVLAARGLIGDGEEFVNESVIGTRLRRPHRRPHDRRRHRRRSCPRSPGAPGSPASTSSCSTPTTRSRRASGSPTPGAPGSEAARPQPRRRRARRSTSTRWSTRWRTRSPRSAPAARRCRRAPASRCPAQGTSC